MKKIKLIATILCLLNSNLYAEISQEQLNDYLKVSRGGEILQFIQFGISWTMAHNLDYKDKDYLIKEFLILSKEDEFITSFTSPFKQMSNKTYHEIMAFYATKEGNSSVQIAKEYSETTNSEDDFNRQYTKLIETSPLSEHKKLLFLDIFKKFDTIKIKRENLGDIAQ